MESLLRRLGMLATIGAIVAGGVGLAACKNGRQADKGIPIATAPETGTSTAAARPNAGPVHRVVAGTTLVAAPAVVSDQCKRTAQVLGFAVPCPSILPDGSYATTQTCGIAQLKFYISPGCGLFYQRLEGSIEFPSDNRVGHLVIEAATGRRSVPEMINGPAALQDPVGVVRRGRFERYRSVWVEVPRESSSINGGHTVLLWYVPKLNVTFGVSLHGSDRGAYLLARAVASSVRTVRPEG